VEPLVAGWIEGNVGVGVGIGGAETVEDDGVFDVAGVFDRLVGGPFERDLGAATVEAVAGEKHRGLGVPETGSGSIDTETGEDGDGDRAELETAIEDRDDLRNHGHIKGNGVTGPDIDGFEVVCDPVGLTAEFVIREFADRPVLTLPDAGDAVSGRRIERAVAIDRVVGDVQLAAGVPLRELRAVGIVADGVEGLVELDTEVVGEFAPEPLDPGVIDPGIGSRAGDEFVVVVDIVLAHEGGEVRRLDERRRRLVDDGVAERLDLFVHGR